MSVSAKIENIIKKFRTTYLSKEEGKRHISLWKDKEAKEVKDILDKLKPLQQDSEEFEDLVLYGLLPNYDTSYAKRISIAPSFQNIKEFFKKRFGYKESDFKELAIIVYKLVIDFENHPDNLANSIKSFTSNRLSKALQCGSLTPIFFALNPSFPVVNNRTMRTYEEMAGEIGEGGELSQKLDDYPINISKIQALIKILDEKYKFQEIKDLAVFDTFCYWYDQFGKVEKPAIGTIWKFSPGKGASLWTEFKKRDVIAMGSWGFEMGDLTKYKTKQELGDKFPDLSWQAISQLFHFKDDIKKGDLIVVYGGKAILGFGIVEGDGFYRFDDKQNVEWWGSENLRGMQHWRLIHWVKNLPYAIDLRNEPTLYDALSHNNTIDEIEDPEIRKRLTELYQSSIAGNSPRRKVFGNPLNIIIYGPPGTGKTYATKAVVIAIEKEIDARQTLNSTDLRALIDGAKTDYEQIKKEGRLAFVTFHPSYAYDDFVEGIRAKTTDIHGIEYFVKDGIFKNLCEKAREALEENQNAPKYYLIIDEINRGNISKIFGELVTLIEEDKRIGNENEITLELPCSFSGEKDVETREEEEGEFGIPNNLYIIGTMNTADRSIALVDLALRRRFDFLEIMPKPELLATAKVYGINLGNLLRTINNRIVEKGERDKQIGHAYLMKNGQPISNEEDLKNTWFYKILPLINEYFYGRWEDIAYVLSGQEEITENSPLPFMQVVNAENGIFDYKKAAQIPDFGKEIGLVLKIQ